MVGKVPVLMRKLIRCRFVQVACSRYILAICLCTISIVCLISVHVPLSMVYKHFHNLSYSLDLARKINKGRYDQAVHYFRSIASTNDMTNQHSRTPYAPGQLVVCIITADRSKQYITGPGKMGYLIQTAAAMDYLVKTDNYFKNTTLFICNIEHSPSTHRDAEYLKSFIPHVQRYGSNSFGKLFPNVTGFVSQHTSWERGKEMEDYIFCLNASFSFRSPYVLMLEDDIIVERNIFRVVNYTLNSHNLIPSSTKDKSIPRKKFAHLKLYYPPRWQGYAFELDRLVELFCVGCLGGPLLVLLCYLSQRGESNYSNQSSHLILGGILSIVYVLVLGRQNMIELRRLSPQLFKFTKSPGCCTPAMFYPSEVIPDIINFLITHSHMNKDLAISAFSQENNVPGYFLEPNLAYHIGMYTSLGRSYKPPEEFSYHVPLF